MSASAELTHFELNKLKGMQRVELNEGAGLTLGLIFHKSSMPPKHVQLNNKGVSVVSVRGARALGKVVVATRSDEEPVELHGEAR